VTGGLLENILNAVAAGLIIGCLYGPMCIGLGLIFGTMSVVNLAQVERLMLSLYISLYLVTGFAAIGFLGPYAAPFVAALIAGRCCSAGERCCSDFCRAICPICRPCRVSTRAGSGG
jgi:branched-chain amino acid transport system permease protein